MVLGVPKFNPIALRMAKTLWSFLRAIGLSKEVSFHHSA